MKQATYVGGPGATVSGPKGGGTPDGETALRALAIASNGGIYVGGDTNSDQIPGMAGGAITDFKRGFISLLSADLTSFTQSTYIGGTNNGGPVHGLDFLAGGDLIAVGFGGDGVGFPAISNADDTSGAGDAYASRIAPDLKTIKQSTMIGGDAGYEEANDVAISSTGKIYVTGRTTASDFHKTAGGADSAYSGSGEGFVALFDNLKSTSTPPPATDECTFFVIKAKNGHIAVPCL